MKKSTLQIFSKILIALLLIVLIVWVGVSYHGHLDPYVLQRLIRKFGAYAPLVFISVYVVATVCFVPSLLLMIAGGLIFGPVYGTVYNMLGSVIGIFVAFVIARYFSGDWLMCRSNQRVQNLIQGFARQGWLYVAFLRLLPVMPFNILNYAMGLTKIPLGKYVLASAIFTLPGCIAYTYVGYVGREAFTGGEKLILKISVALVLLVLVSILPLFIKKFVRSRSSHSRASEGLDG